MSEEIPVLKKWGAVIAVLVFMIMLFALGAYWSAEKFKVSVIELPEQQFKPVLAFDATSHGHIGL